MSWTLVYINWVFLHHTSLLDRILQVFSQVLARYFTGEDMVLPSVVEGGQPIILERELVTRARTECGVEEIVSQEFVLRMFLTIKDMKAATSFATKIGDDKLAILLKYVASTGTDYVKEENNILLKPFLDQIDFHTWPDRESVCEGLSDILTISALVSENILFVLLENILIRMDDKLKQLEVVEEYCESQARLPSQLFMPVDECSGDGLELYQLCRWVVCIFRVPCLDKLDALHRLSSCWTGYISTTLFISY